MTNNYILNEIFWFAQPIYEAADNEESTKLFLLQFGYLITDTDAIAGNSFFKLLANTFNVIFNKVTANNTNKEFNSEDLIEFFQALKTLRDDNTTRSNFSTIVFDELFDYLLYRYLTVKKPFLFTVLRVLGIIEINSIDAYVREVAYFKIEFKWERFSQFITNNRKWAKEVYGWNANPNAGDVKALDYDLLLKIFVLLIDTTGLTITKIEVINQENLASFLLNNTEHLNFLGATLPVLQDDLEDVTDGIPIFSKEAGFKLVPYGDLNQPQNLGFAVAPYVKGVASSTHDLSENLKLFIKFSNDAIGGQFITITPLGISNISGGNVNAAFQFELKYADYTNNKPVSLISFSEKSKIQVDAVKAALGGNIKGEFYVSGGFEKLDAIIDFGSDGLLSNFIKDPVNIAVGNIIAKWQYNKGVNFEGGNNIAIVVPVHIDLGLLKITAIGLALELENKTNFILDVTGSLNLGPLTASFEGFGINAIIKKSNNGILGKYDLSAGIKPPKGIGLSINAGAVTGGGYLRFNPDKEEYEGNLELTIAGFISAKAIGLITTRMPDGSKGFSLLIIITTEFPTGIQIGFGFTLLGVGGLLGLNRTVLIDPLRNGVRTGTVNSILFPQNVTANAPRIISDLKTVFPPYEGRFLVGPMAKLGWGTPTLIRLSFGLIIEIPGNIAIIGVLNITLPEERARLVKINVAFVGFIDFDKKLLSFDASLFESSLLTMTLEGDMAARMKWGDNPDFILSVGGFHPSYTPPPLALPVLRRLAVNILSTSIARIRVECYLAVTSNTVQFGARAEVFFGLSACSINGHISFDALLQFSPFYFITELSAGFALKVAGLSVLSVHVQMSLAGTTPWRAKGTGSVSLLFFDISADFDTTWGDNKDTTLPDIDILQKFVEEIKKREQWSTALPAGKKLLVTLGKPDEKASSPLILHPAGSLIVRQKLVPLGIKIDKVGNQKTHDVQKIVISGASSDDIDFDMGNADEDFALAQYQNMTDAEKLSRPSFEKMPGGVNLSLGKSSIKNGKMARKKVAYEITIVDKEPKKPLENGLLFIPTEVLFTNFLKGNSTSKSVLSKSCHEKLQPFTEKVDVLQEGYSVAYQAYNLPVAVFPSEAMAQSYLQEQISKNPSLKKEIHIIPNYELQ